jgi:Cohesin domain
MKKILVILLAVFIVIAPVKAFAASDASVEVKVSGDVKKGSNIEILVDVKNVDNLYAASIDFTYNTNQLEVESIKPTEYITKNIDNIMELGGETDKNGDTAIYSFTFLGDVDGLMGSGTLVKINAKVLNNDELSITKENMKIKLVQKADGTVKNYDYNFIGYNGVNDSSSGSSNEYNNGSNNNGSNNTSGNGGVDGNSSFTSDSGNSGSNSLSNAESNNLQSSDNKSSNDGKSNDKNNSNGESSSNSEDNKEIRDKSSNNNDGKMEVSKNNIANVVYVLMAIVVLGGLGYYYYKFRKNKNKDN